jgi:acetolactate synthase-1/2/3 large subunit
LAIESITAVESKASPDWLSKISRLRAEYTSKEHEKLFKKEFNVYGVAKALSSISSGKVFVPASSGYAEETFTRFFMPKLGARFFNGAALGAMGMGLPNAIGAAFGTTAQVMCVEADGGLMLNVQELATLSHYAPPGFVLFVLNNGGYESIRSSQKRHFGAIYGADGESGLFIPDLKDLASTFKLEYVSITNNLQLELLLPSLKPDRRPIVVDLNVEKFEYRGPSVKTIMDAQGKPSTTALGEIDW